MNDKQTLANKYCSFLSDLLTLQTKHGMYIEGGYAGTLRLMTNPEESERQILEAINRITNQHDVIVSLKPSKKQEQSND
jgi:hypothetical protein